MTATILTTIGATVLILQAAARIPPAVTDLLRAFVPLREALRELLRRPDSTRRLRS
jgi:hypothetical protein